MRATKHGRARLWRVSGVSGIIFQFKEAIGVIERQAPASQRHGLERNRHLLCFYNNSRSDVPPMRESRVRVSPGITAPPYLCAMRTEPL